MKFQADVKVIASIYPGKLRPITKYFGPSPHLNQSRCTVYDIPPVPKGGAPETLKISDMHEEVPDLMASNSKGIAKMTKVVPCEEIVAELMAAWAGNLIGMPSDASPGIMPIIGMVPTTNELRHLKTIQSKFFELKLQEGDDLHNNNGDKRLSEIYFVAAAYLGKDRVWARPGMSENLVACRVCKTQIPEDAIICKQCGTRLRALPADLAALNPQMIGETVAAADAAVQVPAA